MINRTRVIRLVKIFKEKGVTGVARQIMLVFRREILNPYYHLYYLDLATVVICDEKDDNLHNVKRYVRIEEMSSEELSNFYSYRDRRYAEGSLKKRFDEGSELWMLKEGEESIGFFWSLVGKTMKSHFFKLSGKDAHIYDAEIYLPFRGRGLNKVLMRHMFKAMMTDGLHRVYGETKTWNIPMQKSFKGVGFSYVGTATKLSIFNRTIVIWKNSLDQNHF